MILRFNDAEDILIVHMNGELDHHSAEEVRNKIDDKLDRLGFNKLIMDFSGVTFMDSSGIGAVIGRYKKLSLRNGRICMANVSEPVKRVFRLSGMFKIIKLFDDVEQAVQSF